MQQDALTGTTTAANRLNGLDHLRTLAILLVFLSHYGRLFPNPEWVNTICKFGWTGVDLFFVLSGYLIAGQLFAEIARGKPISLKTFFIKRFFRIIPPYLVVLTLYFCFPYVREWEGLAPLWKYLSFTQNIGLDQRSQRTFSHAWSLCIEEQFYLLLPLLLLLLTRQKLLRKGYLLLLVLFGAGFLLRAGAYQYQVAPFRAEGNASALWYQWIYYPTWCRLDGLLAGVGIAALFRFRPLLKAQILRYGNRLLLLGLLLLCGAYFLCLDQQSRAASVWGFPLVSIGYGVVVMGTLSPGSYLSRFQSVVTAKIATLSYGIYLVHKMVIHLTQDQLARFSIDPESNLMFFLCILSCLAAAGLLYIIVERPFLKLRIRLLTGNKT